MQAMTLTKEQLAQELIRTRAKLAQVTAAFQSLQTGDGRAAADTKMDMRNAALRRRNAVDGATRARLGQRLATVGADLVAAFRRGRADAVVSLYSVIGSEPDVAPLTRALAGMGAQLALPVDWSHGGPLVYRRWAPGDRLAIGPMGIAEPLPEAGACEPDVLVIPVVAFDRRGFRIGYGAGNVDRTLAKLRAAKRVLVIGVAFAVQEELVIPAESHDQALDVVVTERETITVAGP